MMKIFKKIFLIFIFFLCIFTLKVYAKDITIVIDPGHGGIDAGSVNKKAGIIEKDVNLKIARYLKQYLEEYINVKVIMTHNGFEQKKFELIDRALIARNNKADLLISIHCNASDTSKTVNGAEAYVTANKSLPKYNQECSKLANLILDNISNLGIRRIGVKTRLSTQSDEVYSDGTRGDYYGIIRYAMKGIVEGPGANIQNGEGIPAVLVEHCYIQNGDEKYINNENGIKKLAKADCDAIAKYYGLKLKSKVVSGISLDKSNLTIVKGDILSLNATISPSTAEDKKIIWSSNNEKVAIVNNGKVTGISEGEAVITAKANDGGFVATCKVVVKNISINIGSDKFYTLKGNETKLSYVVNPYLPNGDSVKLKIENNDLAEINSEDVIIAKEEGNTSIIVEFVNSKNEVLFNQSIPLKISKLEDNEFIKIEQYIDLKSIITKIKPQTIKKDFMQNIKVSERLEVVIEGNQDIISTGTKINILRKKNETSEDIDEIIKQYTCLIYGDVNSDGIVDAIDLLKIRRFLLKKDYIEGINYQAMDTYMDSEIDAMDLLKVRRYLLGKDKID